MFCENCGNKLNTASNFCTKCGEKVNRDNLVTLTLTREKSYLGMAMSIKVFVDETEIGVLKNGTSLTYDVPGGIHKVGFKTPEKNVVQEVNISENTNGVEIVVAMSMGILTGKAKIKNVIYR